MQPYYHQAQDILKVRGWDYPISEITNGDRQELFEGSESFETRVLHRSPPVRFGFDFREELKNSPKISVYLNASVVGIDLTRDGNIVERVRVQSLTPEKTYTVEGKRFVLAAGGIENPRLLLVSSNVASSGIGNEHDIVGRFFMEHIEIDDIAKIFFSNRLRSHHLYQVFHQPKLNHAVEAVVAPTQQTMEKHKLANGAFFFSHSTDHRPGFRNSLVRCVRRLEHAGEKGGEIDVTGGYFGHLDMRFEQRPNPSSRVTLSSDKDELGLPRVHLQWQLLQDDLLAAERSVSALAHEIGRRTLGRMRLQLDEKSRWKDFRVLGGAHHIGTTRMSESAKTGVVDSNCRVHSVENLYVAGSSVFPTAGFANPTLTIVALALRLADHLKELL
jgi:choline dehydrogenase-like flavoprotein